VLSVVKEALGIRSDASKTRAAFSARGLSSKSSGYLPPAPLVPVPPLGAAESGVAAGVEVFGFAVPRLDLEVLVALAAGVGVLGLLLEGGFTVEGVCVDGVFVDGLPEGLLGGVGIPGAADGFPGLLGGAWLRSK
jgi:hypothetical protein